LSRAPTGLNPIDRPFLAGTPGFLIDDVHHRKWLRSEAERQLAFFRTSTRAGSGFFLLDFDGKPLTDDTQELHTATRLVHSFALGQVSGFEGCEDIVDHGLGFIWKHHRDDLHGGYVWAIKDQGVLDGHKLAYGHAFVLLAAASAHRAGHPDALRMLEDVWGVLDTRFWEERYGLFSDEWARDWLPFSNYRGMNANMHSIEALLTAFEATGREIFLERAGRILNFFVDKIAPAEDWRLPEHYNTDWKVDRDYSGNPMFRPSGTTPGHSFELARLNLRYWDLTGRHGDKSPQASRRLVEQAMADAWNPEAGGLAYTLGYQGKPEVEDRYWWPVTEAIGAIAALIKLERKAADESWYRQLWTFASDFFIDHEKGGWFPEIDAEGHPVSKQFKGKPDIYHSLQAALFPLSPT